MKTVKEKEYSVTLVDLVSREFLLKHSKNWRGVSIWYSSSFLDMSSGVISSYLPPAWGDHWTAVSRLKKNGTIGTDLLGWSSWYLLPLYFEPHSTPSRSEPEGDCFPIFCSVILGRGVYGLEKACILFVCLRNPCLYVVKDAIMP